MPKGKRRKTNNSKTRKKQNKIDIDLAVVSMIIVSILLTVLIYTSSGYIGKTWKPEKKDADSCSDVGSGCILSIYGGSLPAESPFTGR